MSKPPPTRPAELRHGPPCTSDYHNRLKASNRRWLELPFPMFQSDPITSQTYEQRTCQHCGSSLMRPCEVQVTRYLREPRPAIPRHVEQGAA